MSPAISGITGSIKADGSHVGAGYGCALQEGQDPSYLVTYGAAFDVAPSVLVTPLPSNPYYDPVIPRLLAASPESFQVAFLSISSEQLVIPGFQAGELQWTNDPDVADRVAQLITSLRQLNEQAYNGYAVTTITTDFYFAALEVPLPIERIIGPVP